MNEGWIKIHRQIKEWQHYQEPNVLLVWLDLLTSANTKEGWWHGRKIRRGELFTSVETIHQNTGLDVKTIRKALATLEESGEIKREATNAWSKIIINQYNKFQSWGNDTQPLPQLDTQPLPQRDTQPLPQRLPHQQEEENNNKLIIQERKKGVGDAPAREDFLETFGLLNNVKMAPEQHRHLIEDYGQEATEATIDDLSCKLADGTVDSSNHYATLLSWLRYQRRNGGTATMSSTQAVPTYIPPQEPEFTPREQAVIDDFNAWQKEHPDRGGVYDFLKQLSEKHGGVSDKVCQAIGMKYYANKWHF